MTSTKRGTAGKPARPTTIGVVGGSDIALRWKRSLLGIDHLDVQPFIDSAGDDLAAAFTERALEAVVLTSTSHDLLALAKRALVARCHVMVAVHTAVDSRHLLELHELARGRGLSLLFDAGGFADEGLDFARRMTRGTEPMWRKHYLRMLRCEADGGSLDAIALDAMSRALSLCEGLPSRVSALGTRFDAESGSDGAATIALGFDDEFLVRLDVSVGEVERRDEITLACAGRTVSMDRMDGHSFVRIASGGSAERRGTMIEVVSPRTTDRMREAAVEFVTAIRDAGGASNAREIAASALIWETARASMARGGDPLALPANHPLVGKSRPSLHVIEGGGHTTDAAAPRLRVVQGGRRDDTYSEPPPRSA